MPSDLRVAEVDRVAIHGAADPGHLTVSVAQYGDEPLIRLELSGASGFADLELLTVSEVRALMTALDGAVTRLA